MRIQLIINLRIFAKFGKNITICVKIWIFLYAYKKSVEPALPVHLLPAVDVPCLTVHESAVIRR